MQRVQRALDIRGRLKDSRVPVGDEVCEAWGGVAVELFTACSRKRSARLPSTRQRDGCCEYCHLVDDCVVHGAVGSVRQPQAQRCVKPFSRSCCVRSFFLCVMVVPVASSMPVCVRQPTTPTLYSWRHSALLPATSSHLAIHILVRRRAIGIYGEQCRHYIC